MRSHLQWCMALLALAAGERSQAQIKSLDETYPTAESLRISAAGEESSTPTFSWKISLNPSWGRRIDVRDDPITNQNAVKLTFGVEQPVSDAVYIAGTLGAQADPKFASNVVVPGAAAFGQAKLGARIPVGNPELQTKLRDTLDLGATYKLTSGYKDDDDSLTDDDFTDHQLGTEVAFTNVRYLRARSGEPETRDVSAYWKATLGYARVLSNVELREKHAFTGTFDWNYAFYEAYPDINIQGGVERSRYDERVDGLRRRETLLSLFGGLDVKKYARFGGVQKAVAGLKLSRLKSSLPEADDFRAAFQISLDFGG